MGLRFDRFFAARELLPPAGLDSTGRHPSRFQISVRNYSTRSEKITIAQILRGADDRAAHFTTKHVGASRPLGFGPERCRARDRRWRGPAICGTE